MKLSDFDYDLPESLIAQQPAEPRDSARLLHLDRQSGQVSHYIFHQIADLLRPGDVLVMNNTRVIPARLRASKTTGGQVEVLLLRQLNAQHWRVLVGGRGVRSGTTLHFEHGEVSAQVTEELEGPERILRFDRPVNDLLHTLGEMPLPPYIHSSLHNGERYQTVYSRHEGSAAAPTAGLHFTDELLLKLRQQGVKLAYCTLHIGLDTFKPVTEENITEHPIHSEYAILQAEEASIINQARLAGGRIIAVGTTSARTLETAAILSAGGDPADPETAEGICGWRPVIAFEQDTRLFIYPGYRWRVVDAIITNFHLPRSTLLMMLSAFAGRETILQTYERAKREGYRFYSFGDAMLIT